MKAIIWIIIIAALIAGGVFFFGNTDDTTTEVEGNAMQEEVITENEIEAQDQKPSEAVIIEEAHLLQDAYVVIHRADEEGKPGAVIGVSGLLKPGDNEGATVALTEEVAIGDEVFAMLHIDNGDEVYEFPGEDVPMKDDAGSVLMVKITFIEAMTENTHDGDTMMQEAKVFDVDGVNFAFSQTEIRVKKGDKVRINFTSTEGFHDWVVDEFDAKTERVQAGSTTSVEFVATETGTFEYYCSVGSHRQLGMVGTLIVE